MELHLRIKKLETALAAKRRIIRFHLVEVDDLFGREGATKRTITIEPDEIREDSDGES